MIQRFKQHVLSFAQWMLGIVGTAMILIETYSVFCRNVTHWSTPWVDELLRLLFVWIVFVGAAVALQNDELISLTLLEDTLREKGKIKAYRVIKCIGFIIVLVISVLLMVQTIITMQGQILSGEMTPIMGYPLWLKSLGVGVGFCSMSLIALYQIYKLLKKG